MASADPATIDGYVADSLYPSAFHAMFSPPWTNAILRHHGLSPHSVTPPAAERAQFTLVDLGCGDGIGLILNATAHPEARFIGIDAMQEHIDRGNALIAEIGLSNITLHCQTFAQAIGHGAGIADYVTCQGVLAWVSPANQAALIDLAVHLLRPGGALTIGYNCYPGWGDIAPFQRTVRALALGKTGGPVQRFDDAIALLKKSGGIATKVWDWLTPQFARLPADYFAHEYLNDHWQPLWADDVVTRFITQGLTLVGDARPTRLRPDFALKQRWRETLAQISDIACREAAADVLTNNWFRTDIYVKSPSAPVSDDARFALILAGWWRATSTAAESAFEARTPAGTITFDNAAAHAIIRALETGPAPLSAIEGVSAADLANTADALFMAGLIQPACAPVSNQSNDAAGQVRAAMNSWISRQSGSGATINALIGRCGVADFGAKAIATLSRDDRRMAGIQ